MDILFIVHLYLYFSCNCLRVFCTQLYYILLFNPYSVGTYYIPFSASALELTHFSMGWRVFICASHQPRFNTHFLIGWHIFHNSSHYIWYSSHVLFSLANKKRLWLLIYIWWSCSIWVQILDKAVCISLHVNALGKGMNPSLLAVAMRK